MQVIVNDLLVSYDKAGKGPPILMLHGWGDSRITFKELTAALASKYTVIALDLPGFGQTQPPSMAWKLDDYTQFVQDFADKLGIRPFAIIAHSNGGALAIRGLAQGVLKTDKLVLLASAGIRNRKKLRRLGLKVVAKTGKVATFWLPSKHKRALQRKLYGAAGSDMMVAPHLQETFKVTVRQDVQEDAKKLHAPTLIIYGDKDKATPTLYGKAFSSLIPKNELHVLEGAGHFVHHDKPDKVSKLVKEFLN